MSAFNLKSFTAELVGTFALIFVGATAAIIGGSSNSFVSGALAFGLGLAVLVMLYGPVSGGHFNPAVTFGMALNGTLKWGQAAYYWLAQFLGGLIAGLLTGWVLTALAASAQIAETNGFLTKLESATAQTHSLGLLLEAVMGFVLVTAYLRTRTNAAGSVSGALAVGSALAIAILAGGGFVGGSFNPAQTLGAAIVSAALAKSTAALASPFTYVVYFFGPLIGATLAVLLNNFFESAPEDEDAGAEDASPEDPGAPAANP